MCRLTPQHANTVSHNYSTSLKKSKVRAVSVKSHAARVDSRRDISTYLQVSNCEAKKLPESQLILTHQLLSIKHQYAM